MSAFPKFAKGIVESSRGDFEEAFKEHSFGVGDKEPFLVAVGSSTSNKHCCALQICSDRDLGNFIELHARSFRQLSKLSKVFKSCQKLSDRH